jgi:hypothetical protein
MQVLILSTTKSVSIPVIRPRFTPFDGQSGWKIGAVGYHPSVAIEARENTSTNLEIGFEMSLPTNCTKIR